MPAQAKQHRSEPYTLYAVKSKTTGSCLSTHQTRANAELKIARLVGGDEYHVVSFHSQSRMTTHA